jgi:hypothetical protein
MNVAHGSVKEARPDRAVGFYHRRNPRGIAARRYRKYLIDAGSKMTCDAAELVGSLDKESGVDILPVFADQRLDLAFEGINVAAIQCDSVLTFDRPSRGTIEG